MLIPILASKFATDLRAQFARKFTGNFWLLDELLFIFKNELEAKKRSVNPGDKHFEKGEFSRYRSTTSSFHTGRNLLKAIVLFVVASIIILIDAQK